MLVLTRREGETIVIDENIHVTLLSIHGEKVRLGIEAPPTVLVDRQEIHEKRLLHPDGPPSRTEGAQPARV